MYKRTIRPLSRAIVYVYKRNFLAALLRDIAFILGTGVQMGQIAAGGMFIDSTADLLLAGEFITPQEFLYTDSAFWLMILLLLFVLNSAISSYRSAVLESLSRAVSHQANLDIMSKVASENLQEVEQQEFQDLVAFVPNYSISSLMDTYNAFSEMMRFLITLLTAITILARSMGSSVIFLIFLSIPLAVIKYVGDQRILKYRENKVEGVKFINYITNISTSIPDFAELRVNGIFSFLIKAFRKENKEYLAGETDRSNKFHSDSVIFSTFNEIMRFGYIVYVLFIAIAKSLSIGQFKALYDYTFTTTDSAYNALRQMTIMFDRSSYARAFFNLLDYEGFGDMKYGNEVLGKGTPRIELQNLDFMYPDEPDRKVLEDVNVVIEPGEKIAFVGADGSGKSSLVKTLCGLYEIVAGDYVLDGYSIRELKRGQLKNKISVVFQNFVRYNLSLKRNITISSKKTNLDKKLYEDVKKVTGVDKFMKKEGIDDNQILGKFFKGGKELSPGHWQRLSIARMLYRNKPVYIMDEPFTFIDGPSREEILNNILKFVGKEKTIIYITQNTDNLDLFDSVYYIYNGKVLENGTYHELMKKRGRFYKVAMSNR